MIRKVKDFRSDCKSSCKRDCYAGGCPYAGAGCKIFDTLLDFDFLTKGAANGKNEKEKSDRKGRAEKEKGDRKKGGTEKEKADGEKSFRSLQI